MNILVSTRLFSGLVDSVLSKKWRPRGIPAIYKLLEELSRRQDINLTVVFTCKNHKDADRIRRVEHFSFDDLDANITILPYITIGNYEIKFFRYTSFIITEIFHFIYLVYYSFLINADVIYSDRNNVLFAGFEANCFGQSVILRLLGIYPDMINLDRDIRIHTEPFRWILKKSYSASYKYVLCTQDGSKSKEFLDKIINNDVYSEVKLNGVTRYSKITELELRECLGIGRNTCLILWVGTFVNTKGPIAFVDAIATVRQETDAFHAIMVGDGPLRNDVMKRVEGLEDVITLTGLVEHEEVATYMSEADIYVSINEYGNLSNTVLEAIANEKCIVTLGDGTHKGEEPASQWCIRVEANRLHEELPETLLQLIREPHRRSFYSSRAAELAREIPSWEARINYEVQRIVEIASGMTHIRDNSGS